MALSYVTTNKLLAVDFLELAKSRRSVRSFTEQPLTDQQLDTLMQAAIAAPSAGNRQAWHFYVVRTPALKTAIAEQAANQPWIGTAPAVIVVCADPAQNADRYAARGQHLYTIQDTAAAIENILLCATSMGLAGCWCGGFDEDTAAEILKLPAGHRPVALVPLGYQAGPTPEPRGRRPLADAVTYC
jgi:nitroreductase